MTTNKTRTFVCTLLALLWVATATAQGVVPYITKSEFEKKVIKVENIADWKYLGDKPAIIDFTASWCPPCKKLAPILDDLFTKYGKNIYIYKVDVDKEGDLAKAFGVQSIPTMLYIPMNGKPESTMGLLSKEDIEKRIKKLVEMK